MSTSLPTIHSLFSSFFKKTKVTEHKKKDRELVSPQNHLNTPYLKKFYTDFKYYNEHDDFIFGIALPLRYPNMKKNPFRILETSTLAYNCLAHVLGVHTQTIWPNDFWNRILYSEIGVPRSRLDKYFTTIGYTVSDISTTPILNIDNLPIGTIVGYGAFSKNLGENGILHYAIKVKEGWESKCGPLGLVLHAKCDQVSGPLNGKPIIVVTPTLKALKGDALPDNYTKCDENPDKYINIDLP